MGRFKTNRFLEKNFKALHLEPTTFLMRLRSKTANSHQLIEQNNVSQSLMSQNVTTIQYAQYLSKMYSFVHGFEKIVFPLLKNYEMLQLDDRRKSHLIEADLALLNYNGVQRHENDELFSTHYQTAAAALGGMYVLEGSTLGGQIISRHLSKILGNAVDGKTTYLTAYTFQTGSMWKNFLQLLCAEGDRHDFEEEIIASAVKTFSLLNMCLSHEPLKLAEYEN
ncbi:biliverdin-producing heme oxygenase [Flavobacterium sp.]|uniref:biliverdin-producing heme oxygenase n=1 Tax=Flavobacterium sp. TaxID=239 RepID=UPI00286E434E|nr:biliverdin-producing heme oxygenase [Flavobacterium sp.]